MRNINTTTTFKVQNFNVHVNKKNIKGTYLNVLPPYGKVRLSAPLHANDEELKYFVLDKLKWINWQRRKFDQVERQSPREYVSGEDHYLFGHRYRLRLIVSTTQTPRVVIENNSFLQLYARPNTSIKRKETIMHSFYRAQLYPRITKLVQKWHPIIGVEPSEVLIKKMKTRWGVCIRKQKRIWLNLELVKVPPHLIEYIFVHEMLHFIEKRHNDRFHALLSQYIPQWKAYEELLDQLPLGYFKWQDSYLNP